DLSAKARGFVSSSYRKGLNPEEFSSIQWVVERDLLILLLEPVRVDICKEG
ncbi:unnamed protein product, partial [marine sediment metagenome]